MLFAKRIESVAAEMLRSMGYQVREVGVARAADLIVTSDRYPGVELTIEVKGSRLTRCRVGRMGYQFILFKSGMSVRIVEHVTLLVCVRGDDLTWFVVPSFEFANLNKVAITSADPLFYNGRWSVFRNAWYVVDKMFQFRSYYVSDVLEAVNGN